MSFRGFFAKSFGFIVLSCAAACSDDTPAPAGTGGVAMGGSAGAAPGGSGGASAGMSGSPAGGSSGAASGGSSGAATAGAGGSDAGSGGAAAGTGGAGAGGSAGTAGSAGDAGAAGAMAGMAGAAGAGGGGGSGGGGAFTLTSPALENMAGCSEDMPSSCDVFPNENISFMNNMNISPELSWTGAPSGTMSFVVVLQDLTNGQAHWVLWNIPPSTTMLPADIDKSDATPPVPAGSQQTNNFGAGDGYFGPGSSCNVYEFLVYALSIATFSPNQETNAGQVRTQLLALGDQILGSASLRGRSNYMMMCND